MPCEVKERLTEQDIRQGMRGITLDGVATKLTLTLTTGPFLIAYALQLGASNFELGLLAAIAPLTQLVQIPAVYLVERLKVRRPISVYMVLSNRTTLFFIGLIPFLFAFRSQIYALMAALLVLGTLGAISQCAWGSWMRDLIPASKRGTVYSIRMSLAAVVGMVAALLAGYFIDWFRKGVPVNDAYGFSVLFFVAFLAGMWNVSIISAIPEPRMVSVGTGIFNVISRPFRDENFRNLMKFLASWNFAVNLATPFFTVYMLKTVGLDMGSVVALTVLSQGTNLAVLRVWGRFMDRFTSKSVLRVCAPLFVTATFLWIFTTMDGRYVLTVPLLVLLHVLMGVSTAGTVLGSSNIAIKLAPKASSAAYLAASSLVASISAGIAPILGGRFADFFAERHFSLTVRWTSPVSDVSFQTFKMEHWDFFFFFAFLVGLLSIYLLGKVLESGEVKASRIVQEFFFEIGRNVKNLATATPLLTMIQFPSLSFLRNRNNGEESNGST